MEKSPLRACGSESVRPEIAELSVDVEVFRIRQDVLDRLLPDVLDGVFQVTIGIEAVDDGRADYREERDCVSGPDLAARGLENLPGHDEGLDAPITEK